MSKDSGRTIMRNEYGFLFEAAAEDEDLEAEEDGEGEDVEDEEGDETDDGEQSPRKKRPPVEIHSDQHMLAVRIVLADPRAAEGFEPILQYAVLSQWGLGANGAKPKGGHPLTLRRSVLKRIPRSLAGAGDNNRPLVTSAILLARAPGIGAVAERRLSCRAIGGVHVKALFEMDGPNSVDQLAVEIKDHWKNLASGPQA